MNAWEYGFDKADQGRKCLRLWAAVVGAAISDACLKPVAFRVVTLRAKRLMLLNKEIAKSKHIPREQAMSAMYFLFDEGRADGILRLLDISPSAFRKNLVACMYGEKNAGDSTWFRTVITDSQRNGFHYNYRWWLANQNLVGTYVAKYTKANEEDNDEHAS